MFRLLMLISILGAPLGEEFANIMIKIFNLLGFVGIPSDGKIAKLDKKLDETLDKAPINKMINVFFKLVFMGPFYIGWIMMKWSVKLPWMLIRKIFRRKRA